MNLNFLCVLFVCSLRKIVQSIVLYAALIQIDKKHIFESTIPCVPSFSTPKRCQMENYFGGWRSWKSCKSHVDCGSQTRLAELLY